MWAEIYSLDQPGPNSPAGSIAALTQPSSVNVLTAQAQALL